MAQQSPPNIVVILGDDTGMWNVGVYTHGMMEHTPNIDRITREGMIFTDHYGQPSCTAGRAAFIMGQLPVRTGIEDPKFGRVGKQRIEDTGKLTRKRMETFDGEVLQHTLSWMDRVGKSGKPFVLWFR